MNSVRSMVGLLVAAFLAAPALAQGTSIDSLDAALQNLGSKEVNSNNNVSNAPSTVTTQAPPVAPSIASPPIATNASLSGIKAPPPALAQETKQTLAASPVLWVYDFSANWCPSCRKLAPVVEEAASKYGGFIKYVPINVDKNQDLVRKLNIAQIPTVMVVDRNGRTLNRLVGLQQGAQIDTILDHYKNETMAAVGGVPH